MEKIKKRKHYNNGKKNTNSKKSKKAKRRKLLVKIILNNMYKKNINNNNFRIPLSKALIELENKNVCNNSNNNNNNNVQMNNSNNNIINWDEMPISLNMFNNAKTGSGRNRGRRKKDEKREMRKKRQCEAFASIISSMNLPNGSNIVDFGCGSCGLTLPLAYTFPNFNFIGVDIKSEALILMNNRAKAANQTNVMTSCGTIEGYHYNNINNPDETKKINLVISLHACGSASDASIKQAVDMNVPYIVAPCCIGKVKFNMLNNNSSSNNTKDYYKKSKSIILEESDDVTMTTTSSTKTSIDDTSITKNKQKEGYINRTSELLDGNNTRCQDIVYPRSEWLSNQLEIVLNQRIMEMKKEELKTTGGGGGSNSISDINNNNTMKILESTKIGLYSDIASSADFSSVFSTTNDNNNNNNPLQMILQAASTTSMIISNDTNQEKVIENNNCIYYGTDHTIFSDKDFYEAASALVGIDRNKWAFENAGYQVRLCTMPGLIASAKSDVLIGWK